MNRREFVGLFAGLSLFSTNLFGSEGDIFTTKDEWETLLSIRNKFTKLKSYIGVGNFNIISFDKVLYLADKEPSIGSFRKNELDFLDKIFYEDPQKYGFYGSKTTDNITYSINEKDIVKVPASGQFLFKGKPLEDYNRILKDVGRDIMLTSGIRNIPKQMSLYLEKIYVLNGNISSASKIIAPPAYTYHAIHDFDVGKKGFGGNNFTTLFTTTEEFKNLIKLDYVNIRYTQNNKDGVIYEPWHIKVS